MADQFYRFRRIESLLEYNELENQSVFFAAPENLNDPMEGFRDVYWKGDFVVWKNFFRHYLLCLERLCSLALISGEDHPISASDMPVFFGEEDFPTDKYRKQFDAISVRFFENKKLTLLIKSISNRSSKIRRDELYFYFSLIHGLALEVIFKSYQDNGLVQEMDWISSSFDDAIDSLKDNEFFNILESDEFVGIGRNLATHIFKAQRDIHSQIDLINRHNGNVDDSKKNRNLVFFDFPAEYISQIENLIFPEWYTACFMTECTNSSTWGHYGDNHSGVCLIFDAEVIDDSSYLKLKDLIGLGSSGKIYGDRNHKFYPINYVSGYGEIDFFRMLGRVPVSKLRSMWYSIDSDVSECADGIFSDEDGWRNKYWQDFYRDITKKSKDWLYENEYRLILTSNLHDYSNERDRALTYDFKSLKGIIFGIKATIEHKLKIIEIIQRKCIENRRDDFKFYQAYYCSDGDCIKHKELSLLRLNKSDMK